MEPTPPSSSRNLDIATRSEVGAVRTNNEDTALAAPDGRPRWFAVCDGMGGAAGGDVASKEAASVISASVTRGDALEVGRAVVEAIQRASRTVFGLGRDNRQLSGMGTTVTLVALTDALEAVIGQVGDSRAYLLRGGTLVQLTRDQTLVELLVERGQLTREEAKSSLFGNVILQAVGTSNEVDVDLRVVELVEGDILVLCSDGLSGFVDDGALHEILIETHNAAAACDALVDRALAAGSTDNITSIVIRVLRAPRPQGASPARADRLVLPPLELVEEQDEDPPSTRRSRWSRFSTWWRR